MYRSVLQPGVLAVNLPELHSPELIWQRASVTAAIPSVVWTVGGLCCSNTMSEPTESDKLHLSDKIMIT